MRHQFNSDQAAAVKFNSRVARPPMESDNPEWRALLDSALDLANRSGLLQTKSYVNGSWIEGTHSESVNDPATGRLIAKVSMAESTLVDTAVDAAQQSQKDWGSKLPIERGNMLRKWALAMREHANVLANLITLEQGKPVHESAGEVEYAASFIDWFASEAERTYGETIVSHKRSSRLTVDMQPIGVVGIVTPWNFPSAMITRKAAAAMAAGCTVVVKPAPETPLSALALAVLAERVGIPAGVFNVVHGAAAPLAAQLIDNPRVRALSFTGSTEIGRQLMARAARTVKRVSLELGGHAPFIVFDDAPITEAVAGCMAAKFATSGQDCLAANRIYVQRASYQAFCEALATEVRLLRVGHGLESKVDIGPMTRQSVAQKCLAQIADAVSRGARVLAQSPSQGLPGNFVAPTLLVDVTDDMDIAREETFGPVAAVLPFDSEAEVIERANNSEMGLAAYVFTQSLNRATRSSQQLQYGMVGVNTASFTGPPIPFGGWKQSGLGREGSRHGISEFMELKYTCLGGLTN